MTEEKSRSMAEWLTFTFSLHVHDAFHAVSIAANHRWISLPPHKEINFTIMHIPQFVLTGESKDAHTFTSFGFFCNPNTNVTQKSQPQAAIPHQS